MSSEKKVAGEPSVERLPYVKPEVEFVEIFGEQVMFGTCKASGTASAPTGVGIGGCLGNSCTANGDS